MNSLGFALKLFFIDFIGGIIRWPVWWYTTGLLLRFRWAAQSIRGYARMLAISVWMKNIFVPMFGQRDWQSRIISFFMRTVQIGLRSFALSIWALIVVCLVGLYLVLPIFSVVLAAYHATGQLFIV